MLRGNPLVLPATAHHLGSVAKATGQVYSSDIRKENKFVFHKRGLFSFTAASQTLVMWISFAKYIEIIQIPSPMPFLCHPTPGSRIISIP